MESTYGSDYRWEEKMPARTTQNCLQCFGTGNRNGDGDGHGDGGGGGGGDEVGRSVEARIGRAAVTQARSGGNLAMVFQAEKFLVTNVETTLRRPVAVKAPWNQQEVKRFLGSKYVPSQGGPGEGWISGSGGDRGVTARRHAATWQVVVDKQRLRRARKDAKEKSQDGEREALWAREAKAHELRRATDICGKRDQLNMDLLEVASLASGVSVEEMMSEVDAVVGEDTNARRSAAMLTLADSL